MEPELESLLGRINAVGRGPGGWTRPPWTPELAEAEQVVIDATGMVASRDAAGNLWLTDAAAPAEGLVAAGSHLDTVPAGGAFDGALGVASAAVAIDRLRAAAVPGHERLAVVSFADEEGWRFGTPIFGSRMLTGGYGAEVLDRRDAAGIRLGDACPPDPVAGRGGHRRLAAFVEVHIEQGQALAPAGVALGVGTGLAARARLAWTTSGEANHAGTTPMAGRSDALVAAARLVLAADAAARAEPGGVATVGQIAVEPGGSNVIPGHVTGTLDVRAPRPERRDAIVAAIRAACPAATFDVLASDPGVAFDDRVRAALRAGAAEVGVAATDLASYAGHDAGVLAAAGVPAGMLFVRSPDGISHNPAEHADAADCAAGVAVLEHALARLLDELPPIGG